MDKNAKRHASHTPTIANKLRAIKHGRLCRMADSARFGCLRPMEVVGVRSHRLAERRQKRGEKTCRPRPLNYQRDAIIAVCDYGTPSKTKIFCFACLLDCRYRWQHTSQYFFNIYPINYEIKRCSLA